MKSNILLILFAILLYGNKDYVREDFLKRTNMKKGIKTN